MTCLQVRALQNRRAKLGKKLSKKKKKKFSVPLYVGGMHKKDVHR